MQTTSRNVSTKPLASYPWKISLLALSAVLRPPRKGISSPKNASGTNSSLSSKLPGASGAERMCSGRSSERWVEPVQKIPCDKRAWRKILAPNHSYFVHVVIRSRHVLHTIHRGEVD